MSGPDLADVFAHVADPAWLARQGLFVAEGRHVTRRLLASPRFAVVGLLVTPTAHASLAGALAAMPQDRRPPVLERSQAELDALTRFRLHQGCVAVAVRQALPLWTPDHTRGGLSVLLERVRDPDNVGSIIRSASVLGARAFLMGPECADPFYRKAVRTSMGTVIGATVVAAEPWPDVLRQLAASGHTLVATTPDPAAPPIETVAEARVPQSMVLLVGSEGEGLTAEARRAADVEARIPMSTEVDSLNVAVATAVAVYALSRRTL